MNKKYFINKVRIVGKFAFKALIKIGAAAASANILGSQLAPTLVALNPIAAAGVGAVAAGAIISSGLKDKSNGSTVVHKAYNIFMSFSNLLGQNDGKAKNDEDVNK